MEAVAIALALSMFSVTAYCVEDSLVLCQSAVEEKSNEITAVPKLLAMLDITGAVMPLTRTSAGCVPTMATKTSPPSVELH